MNFIEDYPLANVKPASYNPRKLSEECFEDLKHSIECFGMCKPIIINKNGTIVAGHQRATTLKALGFDKAPCLILDKNMKIDEEIRFNLMHNSIENETSITKINGVDLCEGYQVIQPNSIEIIQKGESNRIYEECNLLTKYGDFGCCIVDKLGNTLHNSDYMFCCKLLNKNVLVYCLNSSHINEFKQYINKNYGEYYYDDLNIKSYSQTHCQMSRGIHMHSRLYEEYVIPNIDKNKRILDFGAGKCFYVDKLKKEGFNTHKYEPFFNGDNSHTINIKEVKNMIYDLQEDVKHNGLYDVVILDSVLNSVINDDFEDKVLTTCNALCKQEGVFYVSTRWIEGINASYNKVAKHRRQLEFLDKNNYSGTFQRGTWTLQHFHTIESFRALLLKYFEDVEVYTSQNNKMQLFAICSKPIALTYEKYKESLDVEFNMEYPNNTFLNIHSKLVENIIERRNDHGTT
jgi:hypothetical protein